MCVIFVGSEVAYAIVDILHINLIVLMIILCIRLKNTISKYLRFRSLQPRFDCQKPSNSEVRSNFLSASVATAYSLFQHTFSKVVQSKIRKPLHMALFIPFNATEEVCNKTSVNCKELQLNS